MRIGLLGTGPWAKLAYAPTLGAHDRVEFAGIWGRRSEAAAALAELHGTRAYTSVDDLFRDSEAVAFALPPAVQPPLAVRAARAGCHLLLEKPPATSVEAARSVTEALAASRTASVVFLTSRFAAERDRWVREMAARGGWYTATATWLGALDSGDNPFADSPWRRERYGALWDVGPHVLSVLLPVLGDVRHVTAIAGGPRDSVLLVTEHVGGASSTATLSLTAPAKAAGAAVDLRGASGVATMPRNGEPIEAMLGRAIDALIDSAATGERHACDARSALRIVEILAAAERALAAGAGWEEPS